MNTQLLLDQGWHEFSCKHYKPDGVKAFGKKFPATGCVHNNPGEIQVIIYVHPELRFHNNTAIPQVAEVELVGGLKDGFTANFTFYNFNNIESALKSIPRLLIAWEILHSTR